MWVYLPTVSNNDTGEEQEGTDKKYENSNILRNFKIYLPSEMFNSFNLNSSKLKAISQNKTSHMSGIWTSIKL